MDFLDGLTIDQFLICREIIYHTDPNSLRNFRLDLNNWDARKSAYIPERFVNDDDKEEVLKAVKENPERLIRASDRLRNDRDVVLAAISKYGLAFVFSGEDIHRDFDMNVTLIKLWPNGIKYIDEDLPFIRELMLIALERDNNVIYFFRNIDKNVFDDPAFMIECYRIAPNLTNDFVVKNLKRDPSYYVDLIDIPKPAILK